MSLELRHRLYGELSQLTLIDPHTHINPHQPASRTLADLLGYHYYTELAHSAGMPREQIEEEGLEPREKVRRLMQNLGPIENTIQYSWLVEMARVFFGFQGDRLTADNWEAVYDAASERMAGGDWAGDVLRQSKLEAVFLTNDFDDPLEGFDTSVYVPCLRTDDLVFHLAKDSVRERLERSTNVAVSDAAGLRRAIRSRFVHFRRNGARACAISLPPDFTPTRVSDARASSAIEALWREGESASEAHRRAAANWVFWTLAEFCDEFRLPFDLMIGVNRSVYPGGVYQGMDLYDSRVSLIQYRELFNAFPRVVFPVSVLASVTNQELTSYAWIFPNVVTNGHWWYSNTPTFIEHDASARLEAVPQNKQIGYYSDMYKLEFALPKFNMYKRILAKILAERFVLDRGWSEEQALELGRRVLRGNVESIFQWNEPIPDFAEESADQAQLAGWAAAPEMAKQTPYDEPAVAGEYTYWPQTADEDSEEIRLADEGEAATALDDFDVVDEDEEERSGIAPEGLPPVMPVPVDSASWESGPAQPVGETYTLAEPESTPPVSLPDDLLEAERVSPAGAPQNFWDEPEEAPTEVELADASGDFSPEPVGESESGAFDLTDLDEVSDLEDLDVDVVEEDLPAAKPVAPRAAEEEEDELTLDLAEDEEVVDLSEDLQLEEEDRRE